MKTSQDLKLDSLSEEELLTEMSLGKISTTVFLKRVLMNLKKIEDESIRNVLRDMTYMIYVDSLY
jgi:hypothetical protein